MTGARDIALPVRSPSQTAHGVALLRAAHQLLDAPPPVLDDPISVRLVGPEGRRRIDEESERFQTPGARGLRAHVVLRSRYAEDRLALSAARGVTQCVILGAGLDTFAFRQPDWARALRIIEVDQPASQAFKREQLALAGIASPPNVTFASIDFERESLREGLRRHGIVTSEPTFFSWLGVTMYLAEPAVDATLRTVAEFALGSEIVLTFTQPRKPDPAEEAAAERTPTLAELAARVGEPWLSYFEPDELERKLRSIGFGTVQFLTPAEAHVLYFADRTDGLSAPRRTSIVRAAQ